MEIHVKPDKEKAEELRRSEVAEAVEHLEKLSKVTLDERPSESGFLYVTPDIEKPRDLKPQEKIAAEKKNETLTEKAEIRQEVCWYHVMGCTHRPTVWVREVQFDYKTLGANVDHAIVSTEGYSGPIPGFCVGHLAQGPAALAQSVYFQQPEMYWGFRPSRWVVVFTDGTTSRGECVEIDPKQQMPEIVEEHISR